MKIVLAKAAGFCMGVRRAMDIVLSQAGRTRGPLMTYGPLIHNPQVIEALRERGIEVLEEDARGDGTGRTVVVRAHGITPDEKEELRAAGYRVVDATCPHVIRIQNLIKRHVEAGDSIVILGDHGHAEVKGLLGYARGRGYVVADEKDVAALPDLSKVCVVSQTTQSYERFEQLLAAVRRRWPDCVVYRTICGSTDLRQKETVEIARGVDVMIVVGGRKSANTVRLTQLAAATGTPTLHVERADELDYRRLQGARTVGVTAGASTPNWMIVEVTERLLEYAERKRGMVRRACTRLFAFLLDTNLYLAAGALSMGYGCAVVQDTDFPPAALVAAALYVFSMYSLNISSQSPMERAGNPLRWQFYERWGRALVASGYVCLMVSLVLSAFLGYWAFGLMLLAVSAGVVYRLPLVPERWAPFFRYRRLMDIPGSKDIFMGLAWAVVLTLFPLPGRPEGAAHVVRIGFTFFFVFTLVFIRSVVFDLRDIQGDRITGRETIPMVLGKERTRVLLATLTGLVLAAMIAASQAGGLTSVGYVMVIPLLYTWGYLYLYHRRFVTRGVMFEMLLGGKFVLVGVLAALWRLWT